MLTGRSIELNPTTRAEREFEQASEVSKLVRSVPRNIILLRISKLNLFFSIST